MVARTVNRVFDVQCPKSLESTAMSIPAFLRRAGRTTWDERQILSEGLISLGVVELAIRLTPLKLLTH